MQTPSPYPWVIVRGPSPFLASIAELHRRALAEGVQAPARRAQGFAGGAQGIAPSGHGQSAQGGGAAGQPDGAAGASAQGDGAAGHRDGAGAQGGGAAGHRDGAGAQGDGAAGQSAVHCLVFHGEAPVAAARLLAPGPVVAGRASFGFGLEAEVELRGLAEAGRFAELSEVCVLPSAQRTTEAVPRLIAALVAASEVLGVDHWCAAASCETESAEEALAFHRLAERLGRVRRDLRAVARGGAGERVGAPLVGGHDGARGAARVAPASGPGLGAGPGLGLPPGLGPGAGPGPGLSPGPGLPPGPGLGLPPTLGMYLSKLGAKVFGRPFRCAGLGSFAMPVAVSIAELASGRGAYSKWLRRLNVSLADNDNDAAGAPSSAA